MPYAFGVYPYAKNAGIIADMKSVAHFVATSVELKNDLRLYCKPKFLM